MQNKATLVSILMTAYNRERFIAEAIESVITSTFQDLELIIVDDGSKDRTVSIAQAFAQKDRRIRVYTNDKNLGDYPNRNKAAGYATGKYIMYVDSDDKVEQDGIEFCVHSMEQFPEAKFGIYWARELCQPFVRTEEEAAKKYFEGEYFLGMGPGGTIINREFFFSVGMYPTKYGPANDMYFNLKVIAHTPIVMLPHRFMRYRIHDGQERNNKLGYLLNNYVYFRDAFTELPIRLSSKEKELLLHKNNRRLVVNLFKHLVSTGDFKTISSVIKQSNFRLKDLYTAVIN